VGVDRDDHRSSWDAPPEVSPDNTRAYVVHNGGKMVTAVDTATNTVIGSITSDQVGGVVSR
jgi:YVTN family beta-propeller protein